MGRESPPSLARKGPLVSADVVIDARAAVRREIGGVERVAREMTARLPALAPGRYAVRRPPRALAHAAGHLWEQAVLPLAARRAKLIYCPANLGPLVSRRTVVVIHDTAALRHPEWYSPLYARYQSRVLPVLARRALGVITDSQFARAEVADRLEVPVERVSVVPLGVDERFSPDADPEPARSEHGLERPYVLAVGSRIARKNLAALSEAARRLRAAGFELVTAGSGRGYMRAEADASLRALGYVADEQLPGLYAGAAAFAMPSLYEGFGLPCLEAMACGTPVVAADRTALPETCGDAALLVDPTDAAAVADALVAAATDEAVSGPLIRAGLERAARYTWRHSAELTDRVLGGLLAD
jgi:glycosyltransferase involved in cell wall biosynthesis